MWSAIRHIFRPSQVIPDLDWGCTGDREIDNPRKTLEEAFQHAKSAQAEFRAEKPNLWEFETQP